MLKKHLSNEKGTAIVLLALAMASLLGLTGLVADVGLLYVKKQAMQNALDAACLAGAQELPDTGAAEAKALEYAALNGVNAAEIEIFFTNNNQKLTLSCSKTQNLFFLPVLGIDSASLHAVAAAEAGTPGQAFDYALFSGSSSNTLRLNGNNLSIKGSAHTNQNFRANGNYIQLTGACEAVGTISANGNYIEIPYRYPNSSNVEMPDYSDEIQAQAQAAGQVFDTTVQFNGNNINVDHSIYVNGDVHINGNTIDGTGAILAAGDIHINGNCVSASVQDQVCIYSQGNISINGNNITIEGVLYAPGGSIQFNGNYITIKGKVIGNTVSFNGNYISIAGDKCTVTSLPRSGSRLVQ
ncbi:MAG: pilus assembly protein TadG-related protein [Peptococcaceae bacterium]|jgi:phage baseplate assembly protein gpV|nr:pilus assembly protein TadG-related protein [Peptococcaceae bacterium]MDH7526361.1 pilus assembly protein TadG-related protein [Peptococcaceae bacterium]